MIDTIALPIELQVNGVDGMLYMQSTSAADGTYSLIMTFKIGMDPDTAQVLVQNRVSNVLASLPQAVQAQGVSVQKKSTAILQIVTLNSPGNTHDALYLSNYATINLVNELARLPGVGNVIVFGAAEYAMRIWLDPEKLYSFGLVPGDVIKAVKQQSQVVAAGQTGMPPAPDNQDFQYTVDIQSRFDDPSQFADIIVKGQTAQGGRLIKSRISEGSTSARRPIRSNAISMGSRPPVSLFISHRRPIRCRWARKSRRRCNNLRAASRRTSNTISPTTRRSSSRLPSTRSIRRSMRQAFSSSS